jgi:DNA-binding transcriptional MerR regulator
MGGGNGHAEHVPVMTGQRRTPLQYPIRAVAQMTGISIDTLRAWERRYEAVVPSRSDRGRLYSDADVERLRKLGDLVKRGHAIGTIASLDDEALARLLEGADAHKANGEAPAATADLAALASALDRYDLDAIEATHNRHAVVLPPRELVLAVIVPLLQEVGRRWESGRLRPAQEHLVSSIIRSVLGGLLRASSRPHASPKIVFATPSGERHELGLLCAALLAASAGYGVVYLGQDLPAADIAHAAATAGARIIVVSLTTPGAVTRAELRKLMELPPGIELWVGGPASDVLISTAGDRVRVVAELTDVVPMLSRHAH